MKINKAIVCTPANSLADGITTSNLGPPDIYLARQQHQEYIQALQASGVEVSILPAREDYPDSTFVEDPAVILGQTVVITNPGAESRKGETTFIREQLQRYCTDIKQITSPGSLDGGDVLETNRGLYVGLTERTNMEGIQQLAGYAQANGMQTTAVRLPEIPGLLHLKTGVSYLGDNTLMLWEELAELPVFTDFRKILIAAEEQYAANCILVNGTVLMPTGFENTRQHLTGSGFRVQCLDMSEFRKMDGGLSCLSLRIE